VPDGPIHVRCGLTLGRTSDLFTVDLTDVPVVRVTAWANTAFPVLEFAGEDGAMLPVECSVEARMPHFLY